jgi:hypothetical protein
MALVDATPVVAALVIAGVVVTADGAPLDVMKYAAAPAITMITTMATAATALLTARVDFQFN